MKKIVFLFLLPCVFGVSPALAQTSEAEQLAQAQLEAYNQRDIDAFLVPYSDSVKVYDNLRDFSYQGKDRMRAGYAGFFQSVDSLHCTLVNRIVLGNVVIDQEEVYIARGGKKTIFEAIAIYTIRNGKIEEVAFKSPD